MLPPARQARMCTPGMTVALAFTAYRRPPYFERTVASWLAARERDRLAAVRVFLEPSYAREQMRRIAEPLGRVHVNARRLGVLVSPWHALETMFGEGHEFVILAEDDIVVSDDVLEYLRWAADAFAADPGVLAVNAFSRRGGDPYSAVLGADFSPLIWGTWRDRWANVLRDTWDKDYGSGDGEYPGGWDWNIRRIVRRDGWEILQPCQSRSDHIGELGGAHMNPQTVESARGVAFTPHRLPGEYTLIHDSPVHATCPRYQV